MHFIFKARVTGNKVEVYFQSSSNGVRIGTILTPPQNIIEYIVRFSREERDSDDVV